jgi:hypothetical protein
MDKINKKYYVDNSGNILELVNYDSLDESYSFLDITTNKLDIISSWKVDDYYIELNNESITSLINRIEPR